MYIVNRKRFRQAVREVRNAVLVIMAVIWFCVFIYQHSGLNRELSSVELVSEYVAYEYVVQSDAENPRMKTAVPQKVVYRYIGKEDETNE